MNLDTVVWLLLSGMFGYSFGKNRGYKTGWRRGWDDHKNINGE